MGRTGAKSNQKSGSLTDGLRHKDLKLTVIFAPISRSELLDIYNPIEFPCVDREMRVISRQVESSGNYVAEQQDKVIYINCSTIGVQTACVSEGSLPILVSVDSSTMMDKLHRAIQLIHELLDYWHGYGGTVFTTFCCYQPLEDLMVALQSILSCPGSISSKDAEFFSDACTSFSDAFDLYYEWTFVNKHSSVYKAEYKYESYNGKSEEENLKNSTEDMIINLSLNEKDKEAFEKFRQYQDMSEGIYKTQYRLALEGYVRSHPEYQKHLDLLDKNNKRLKKIEEENQKLAKEWSEKSHGQRLGTAKHEIDKYYDAQIKAAEAEDKRNQRYLDEINEKQKQLDWQQGKKSQFTSEWVTQRSYDAYDIGVERHGKTHEREEIEYNGEYYKKDDLDRMFWALKGRIGSKKRALEAKKEQAWRKAQEDIRKQIYVETVNAGVAIFSIVAIVFAPLAIVDIIVIVGKMCTEEGYAKDWHNWVALGLDIFAVVPFVGAVFKAGGVGASVTDAIVNDVTRQGNIVKTSSKISPPPERASGLGAKLDSSLDDVMYYSDKMKNAGELEVKETSMAKKLSADADWYGELGYAAQDRAIVETKLGNQANSDKLLNQASEAWKKSGDLMGDAAHHEVLAEVAKTEKGLAEHDLAIAQTQLKEATKNYTYFLNMNQGLAGNMPGIGGGAREVIETLPVISLGGFVKDINLYIKNFSNMSGRARAAVGGNIAVQTIGHGGNIYGGLGNLSSLASGPSYTVQSNGDDFVIVAKK